MQPTKPASVPQAAWDRLTDTGKREVAATGKIPEAGFKNAYYNNRWDEVRSLAGKYSDTELSQAAMEVQAAITKVSRILNKKYVWD